MVKVLIKIFLPFFLGSFFALWAFSFAHAEDIEITGYNDTLYLDYSAYIDGTPHDLVSDTMASIDNVSSSWYGGQQLHTGYRISYLYPISHTLGSYGDFLNVFYSYNIASGTTRPFSASLSFDTNNSVVLDTSLFSSGYYHYVCDIYIGLSYARISPSSNTSFYVPASFSLNASEISNDYVTLRCLGKETFSYPLSGGSFSFDLVHFQYDEYFELTGSETSISFPISYLFQYLLDSPISYDFVTYGPTGSRDNRTFYYLSDNRFKSQLWKVDSMPAPPVTPTPTPTPYPGQDTQESINQGVSNIEGQMNQLIDSLNPQVSPIPTPADFTIDETLFDELESMTLPDVSAAEDTFSSLWDIFNPIWWLLALLFSVTFVIGIFLYVLRGGFI